MKEIKLPQLSQEDKNEIFKNLKKGDELYEIKRRYWNYGWSVTIVKVKNITPKGRIRLSNGDLIDSLPHGYYLKNDEVKTLIQKINLEEAIIVNFEKFSGKLEGIFRDNLEYEDAIALWKILSKYNIVNS